MTTSHHPASGSPRVAELLARMTLEEKLAQIVGYWDKDPGEAVAPESGHVTGQEICHAARRLALRSYGAMAVMVLDQWGIRGTSDLGEMVYNLIAAGDLTKTPEDSRSDFDNVFDFETALRPKTFHGREPST